MKRRLKYPLIVEGKYDKIRLSSLLDATIIETNGFSSPTAFTSTKTKKCFRFSGSWPKTARWRY